MKHAVNGVLHGLATCFELSLTDRRINSVAGGLVDEHRRLVKTIRLLPFAGSGLELSG